MLLHDRFGRYIKNLRISVTPLCNLNCFYCHREGIYSFYHCIKEKRTKRLLSADEIKKVVRVTTEFGIREVKLTGGEPLLREDILTIIERIREIRQIIDISLVTNGHFLENLAYKLKESGLDRINVSLPSLNSEKYSFITGYTKKDGVDKVLKGIKNAVEAGLKPVKINIVVLKGINDNEISDYIDLANKVNASVQFIELQDPNGFNSKFFSKYFYPLKDLETQLEKDAEKVIVREMHHRKRFIINGTEIEIVRPMFNREFCMHCTRIRITAEGEFKPCLMRDDNHIDFSAYIDNENMLRQKFLEAVLRREPYFS